MKDLTGQVLGERYRVDAFIDRGGMATVYRAFDLQDRVMLALKALHPDLAEDGVFTRRFTAEATVLQRLLHPNIVRLHSFQQYGPLACLFLEFIDGITLRRRIYDAGTGFPLDEIRHWLKPVCDGLAYAHQVGVYHCDIKPANIMITRQGRVVVSDFGIARTAGGTVATMSMLGTPEFMAPEQWLGRKMDARTDIYALGITIYEMATGGERPFTGSQANTSGSLLEKLRWEHLNLVPPSPRAFRPDLSEAFVSFLSKCLAKDPEERFSNAQETYRAFEDAILRGKVFPATAPKTVQPTLTASGSIARPAKRPAARRKPLTPWLWAALPAALLLAALIVVAASAVLWPRIPTPGQTPTLPLLAIQSTHPEPSALETVTQVPDLPVPPSATMPAEVLPPPLTPTPFITPSPTLLQSSSVFVEYILSSANSMMQPFGDSTRQAALATAMSRHWRSLPLDIHIGLRTFGSQQPAADLEQSCLDTQLLAPMLPGQGDHLGNLWGKEEARGMSPIWQALYAAAGEFRYNGPKNAIVLIVDSGDTCDKDACQWVRAQVEDIRLPLRLYVIGMDIPAQDEPELRCVAERSGGVYYAASNELSLAAALDDLVQTLSNLR